MATNNPKNKQGCDLRTCFLCKMCLPEWNPAIAFNRQHLSFKKGAMIFREGDPVTGIYFVYSGVVKVHKKWGEDKELILRFAGSGDVLGHRGLRDFGEGLESMNALVYPIAGTALEPTTVCFVGLDFFQASLRTNYAFIYSLLNFYATELQDSEQKMSNLAHMPVKGRVALALLELQGKFGVTAEGMIDLNLSRQDLASFAGTTYETVFRVMNELEREGLVQFSGKDIRILQPGLLVPANGETGHQSSSTPI
jgi:CRP-like cAMP-binding protein